MFGGRLSGFKNCSHEVCMAVSRGVVSLGRFLSSEMAGRSRMALRVSREVRREVWELIYLHLGVRPLLRWWVGYRVCSLHRSGIVL